MSKYKADLKIDPFDLNNEILRQPQLFYEYSFQCGIAENDRDDAKDELDIAKVEIELKIRQKLIDSDEKLTETHIKSKVENHPKIKRLKEKFNKARRAFNLLKKGEEAFRQRKSMLQTFVYRETNNMNSSVRTTQPFQREMHDEFSSNIRDSLSEGMNKTKLKIKRR